MSLETLRLLVSVVSLFVNVTFKVLDFVRNDKKNNR